METEVDQFWEMSKLATNEIIKTNELLNCINKIRARLEQSGNVPKQELVDMIDETIKKLYQ